MLLGTRTKQFLQLYIIDSKSSLPDLKSQKHQKSQLFHLFLSFQIKQI